MISKININTLKHISSKFKLLYSSQFNSITKYKNKYPTQKSKLIKKNKPPFTPKYIKKKWYQRSTISKQVKRNRYQRPIISKHFKKWHQRPVISKYAKKSQYQRPNIFKRKNKRFKRIKKKYQHSIIFKRIKRIKKKTQLPLPNIFKRIKKVYRRRLKVRSIIFHNKYNTIYFIKNVRQRWLKLRSNIIFYTKQNIRYFPQKFIIKTIPIISNTIYNQFFNHLLQNHILPITPTKRKQAYLNSLIITPLIYTHYFNYINFLSAVIKKSQQLRKVITKKYKWKLNKHINKNKLLRKRLRRWLTKFRKIKKNNAFITAIRRNFPLLTGISEKSFLFNWSNYRHGSNKYWGGQQLVTLFNHMLLMTPTNLLLFLNIIPSIAVGSQLTKSGGIIINGIHSSITKFIKPGDIFQIIPNVLVITNSLYSYHKASTNNLFLQLPFLQIDYSILLFLVLRWPYPFELIAPSFLSERWVRYYIRQIPVKLKKYHSIKLRFTK